MGQGMPRVAQEHSNGLGTGFNFDTRLYDSEPLAVEMRNLRLEKLYEE